MTRFRVAALPASEGDCLVISYGVDGDLHHIVIDAGRKANAAGLATWLTDQGITHLELLVVTHIDADHIEGMLDFLGAHPDLTIDDIWFNGYKHLKPGLHPMGPVQGEKLTGLLQTRPWNRAFAGKSIMVAPDGAPVTLPALAGGMVLTILSPDTNKLDKLEPVWASEVRKQGLEPGHGIVEPAPIPGLQPMGNNLAEIAATPTTLDHAEANGSSIALLADYGGKRVLLGADAHPDLLAKSLDKMRGSSALKIDLYKAPHHGSQANNSVDLLAKIDCSRFLISTNGAKFHHPDKVAIARMIMASNGPADLHFNYLQPQTQWWRDREPSAGDPDYTCHFPTGTIGISIDLL